MALEGDIETPTPLPDSVVSASANPEEAGEVPVSAGAVSRAIQWVKAMVFAKTLAFFSSDILVSLPSGFNRATEDASSYIQAALNEATPGQAVVLTAGEAYLVGSTILLPGYVTLRGEHGRAWNGVNGCCIKAKNGANLDAVIASKTWYENLASPDIAPRVRDITVDGNKANQTGGKGHGIVFCSYRPDVRHCLVEEAYGDGIRYDGATRNGEALATGSTVNPYCYDNRVSLPNGRCVNATTKGGSAAPTDGFYRDLDLEGGEYGVLLNEGAAGGALVQGVHCYGQSKDGIYGVGCSTTRFVDNYVENIGKGPNIGEVHGIRAKVISDGCVISGNTIRHDQIGEENKWRGIRIQKQENGGTARVALGSNTITVGTGAPWLRRRNPSAFSSKTQARRTTTSSSRSPRRPSHQTSAKASRGQLRRTTGTSRSTPTMRLMARAPSHAT